MTEFRKARDLLLQTREDYAEARARFRWPEASSFNWALDWFDAELAADPASRDRRALWVHDTAAGTDRTLTFRELSLRSNQAANFLRGLGLKRGDHLLLLLGNVPALWEITLAAMKLGVVLIPATTLLTVEEIADRLERGRARAIVAEPEQLRRCEKVAGPDVLMVSVGEVENRWHGYADAAGFPEEFEPDGATGADDPMVVYFTSGTTAKPKLVAHSHRSYPMGALSTMYWLGLRPGDVHLNISSPGWAKHAWSCLFSPWNAGATVLIVEQPSFNAPVLLTAMERCRPTTFCAPPTVWRLLIREDLAARKVALREACAAGEPLNPEVIDVVRKAWGLTIRDGYGQTETTAMVGNAPGQPVRAGSMGRPLPGYDVRVLDPDGKPATEGEVCIALGPQRPAGLMLGYRQEDGSLRGADGDLYRTGDVAFVEDDGTLTFVGRADDVFKSSDYRISPFELESVLIEHEAVVEAAVVPAPDPIRLAVPKAYVTLAVGAEAERETALSVLRFTGERLAPFKRIRSIEFVRELPKTISGKIRRVHLRRLEHEGRTDDPFRGASFHEDDLPELAAGRGRSQNG